MRSAAIALLAGALAACSSMRLPEADMALPLSEVADPFVIRVGEMTPEVLHPLLVESADRAGRSGRHDSSLNVLLLADRDTPWMRLSEVLRVCGDPEVLADRIWYGVTGPDGRAGALLCFLPADRCVGGRSDLREPEFTHRIRVDREPASTSILSRWCRLVRRDAGEATVLVTVDVPRNAPYAAAIAVVNEARRFGFGVELSSPDREGRGSGPWGYDLGVPASAVPPAPPPEPGAALFGDPRSPPKFPVDNVIVLEENLELPESERIQDPRGPFGR